jgi:hypothetical protein
LPNRRPDKAGAVARLATDHGRPSVEQARAPLGAVLSVVGGVAIAFVAMSGKPNPASLVGLLGLALFGVVVVQ